MPDRQKVEAILTNRFPGVPLPQVAAAVNALMALDRNRPAPRPLTGAMTACVVAPRTTIAVSAHIAAPLTRVFDRFTDLEHAPEHVSGIVRIERLSEGRFGVGISWRETRRVLGRIDSAAMEVSAFDRYRGYTITHHKAGVRIDAAFTFDASAAGTLVAIEFSLDGRMPAALLTPVNWAIAGKVQHVLLGDLTDLKASLERER
jgi:polyketide cyclase/dehydrase/lipid transport protein